MILCYCSLIMSAFEPRLEYYGVFFKLTKYDQLVTFFKLNYLFEYLHNIFVHFVQYLKYARNTRKQSLDFQTKFINVINYFVVVIERTGSMCAPLLHCILQIVYITTANFSSIAMNKQFIETNSAVLSCQFWHAVYSRHWEEILCTLAETGHKRLQKLQRNLPQR